MPEKKLLDLEIISPEGLVFKGAVSEVQIPTVQGEIGILPGHAPLISRMSPGEVKVHKDGGPLFFCVAGGFLEVFNNKLSILSDHAVKSDEIISSKAQEARDRAESLLKQKHSTREFAYLEKDLKRSIMELKISSRYKKKP